jgi:hypothetical protein
MAPRWTCGLPSRARAFPAGKFPRMTNLVTEHGRPVHRLKCVLDDDSPAVAPCQCAIPALTRHISNLIGTATAPLIRTVQYKWARWVSTTSTVRIIYAPPLRLCTILVDIRGWGDEASGELHSLSPGRQRANWNEMKTLLRGHHVLRSGATSNVRTLSNPGLTRCWMCSKCQALVPDHICVCLSVIGFAD